MKRIPKKTLAVLLAISLMLPIGLLAESSAAASSPNEVSGSHDYTIDSPYKDVNWNTWMHLKAALHNHTIASDGRPNIDESVEMHYSLGYDILAISDHMVVSRNWDESPQLVPLMNYVMNVRRDGKTLSPLTTERYEEILAGVGRDGRGMLDVPLAIELNGAVPSNTHVNGLFAEYGQGRIGIDGDYETPIGEIDKLGGLTFLDHLGTFTKAYKKNDPSISKKPYYVNKFARIFLDYPSCIAMDINSSKDTDTAYDRILWDEVLQKTIPNGRNVSCITFSDAHKLDQDDRAFTIMMEPENTVANLRTCLETGAYFGISRHAIYELGEDFLGEGATPIVTNLTVDQNTDQITLEGTDYDEITWVSNGNIIATGECIDLNDYEDVLGCYVRAYLTGPGGICYTQAFVLTAPDIPMEPVNVPKTFDYSVVLRAFATFMEDHVLQNSMAFKVFKHFVLGV